MARFSTIVLSGSTNGLNILVTGTATGNANTVHTAAATQPGYDEVWVYGHNFATADRSVTLLWGPTTSIGNRITYTVPSLNGLYLIVPGLPLQNANVISAIATAAGASGGGVSLYGYANRVT